MQSPVKEKTVMGFDPAYRTGCKLAVVDPTGRCLVTSVIYPHPPQNKKEEATRVLTSLIHQFGVQVIAIGNGTASGESEQLVAELLRQSVPGVVYCMVNEAGASVYSASELGAREFPDYDVSLRSAVSIARRLQDPLAELVKIDPRSIGVGQYQHDMNQKKLEGSLRGVVEDCVNNVGVDLNTASPSLLSYISGISPQISRNIVDYRDKAGIFRSRRDLLKIPKLGNKTFEQCAGFLRIAQSDEFLDNTSVHPESYDAAKKLLALLGNPPTS
jgi:protein Tex